MMRFAATRMKGAGNPSPVWEKGRDEGLLLLQKALRRRLALDNQRRSLTPAPLPSGRGVPCACPV